MAVLIIAVLLSISISAFAGFNYGITKTSEYDDVWESQVWAQGYTTAFYIDVYCQLLVDGVVWQEKHSGGYNSAYVITDTCYVNPSHTSAYGWCELSY